MFEFSEPMDDSTFNAADFTFSTDDDFATSDAGASVVTDVSAFGSHSETATDDKFVAITFTPTNVSGTGVVKYKVTTSADKELDLDGTQMEDVTTAIAATDLAKPVVLGLIASQGDDNTTKATVDVTFSEDIDAATIDAAGAGFTFSDASAGGVAIESAAAGGTAEIVTLTLSSVSSTAIDTADDTVDVAVDAVEDINANGNVESLGTSF